VSSWTVFDSLLMGGTKLFHLRSLVLLSEPEMEAAVRSRTPSRPLTLSARAWCKSRTCTQTLTLNLTLCYMKPPHCTLRLLLRKCVWRLR
jgi:hypothetical protein